MLSSSIKSCKNPKIYKTKGDVQVRLWFENGRLNMKAYTSKSLNLSIESMNSVVEDNINLLQCKSNLSPPHSSVLVKRSPCFFKMLLSVFLIMIRRDCLADWKRGQEKRKWVLVSISRPQPHIGLIKSWKLF